MRYLIFSLLLTTPIAWAAPPYAQTNPTVMASAQAPALLEPLSQRAEVQRFMAEMSRKHGFSTAWLEGVFSNAQAQPDIITTMTRPAEAKPWFTYRKIFLTEKRINAGANFWRTHAQTLQRAEREYGVPPEVIVGILGVETTYGENTGKYRVLEALATLAFDYPKRADFFRKELENFLLLAREEGADPLTFKGSYAGAMGLAQFMPSSYRAYAVDFDGDGHRDLWSNPVDAIGSVAAYLGRHNWQRGAKVIEPARLEEETARSYLSQYSDLKPRYRYSELVGAGIVSNTPIAANEQVVALEMQGEVEPEYWVGLSNFYAITRYNRSPLYALAVYQLGQAIRERL